jgi:hypothetical protein
VRISVAVRGRRAALFHGFERLSARSLVFQAAGSTMIFIKVAAAALLVC